MSSTGEPMPGLEKQRVLAAVAQNGMALRDAAPELRRDREVVLAAVARNGRALQCAAAELQRDREVVMAAVAQDGRALWFAAAELKRDPTLLQLQTLDPRVSAPTLAAALRLRLAHTCHERLGADSVAACLPLEVIELIGQRCTAGVAVHGLLRRSAPCEGEPPERGAATDSA